MFSRAILRAALLDSLRKLAPAAGESFLAGLLRNNLLVYGLGGLIAPFVGIKLIDLVLGGLGMA
jgi:K+-transporting ATPase ATPase B chain